MKCNTMTWTRENYILSDNKEDQDPESIQRLLKDSYWASDRSLDKIKKILTHSHGFSLFDKDVQIGFVRVVSDYSCASWIADMIINPSYRGQQLGQWMMRCVMDHPDLKHTQFSLQTEDAHTFYEKLGFKQRPSLMSTPSSYLSA